jgi:hypothetical protein
MPESNSNSFLTRNDICREALKKATPATEEEKKAWTESGEKKRNKHKE